MERRGFAFRLLLSGVGYWGITLWLNSIRTTAALWLIWVLIIVQFTFFFSIFIVSYHRATVMGMARGLAFITFIALAVAARVNDWEQLIIPALLVMMLVWSARTRHLSPRGEMMLPAEEPDGLHKG